MQRLFSLKTIKVFVVFDIFFKRFSQTNILWKWNDSNGKKKKGKLQYWGTVLKKERAKGIKREEEGKAVKSNEDEDAKKKVWRQE